MDIEALMRGMHYDQDGESESLTDVQIIGRLQSIQQLRSEMHKFEPGMIIRHKYPKLSNSKANNAPAIFIRYLAKPYIVADHPEAFKDVTDWASMAATWRLDCVVGVITGGLYYESFAESAALVQATEADYGPIVNITSSGD